MQLDGVPYMAGAYTLLFCPYTHSVTHFNLGLVWSVTHFNLGLVWSGDTVQVVFSIDPGLTQ